MAAAVIGPKDRYEHIEENIINGRLQTVSFAGHHRQIKQIKIHGSFILTHANDGLLKCWRAGQELWSYPSTSNARKWSGEIFVTDNQSVVCIHLPNPKTTAISVLSLKNGSLRSVIQMNDFCKQITVIKNRLFAHIKREKSLLEWDLHDPRSPKANRPIITPFKYLLISTEWITPFKGALLATSPNCLFAYFPESRRGKFFDLEESLRNSIVIADRTVDDQWIYISLATFDDKSHFCILNEQQIHTCSFAVNAGTVDKIAAQKGLIYFVVSEAASDKIYEINPITKTNRMVANIAMKIEHILVEKSLLIAISKQTKEQDLKIYFWNLDNKCFLKAFSVPLCTLVTTAVYEKGRLFFSCGETLLMLNFTL